MDVVVSNVSCKPVQDGVQVEEATAFDSSAVVVPVWSVTPVCVFELVLHIEEPNTKTRAEEHDGRVHREEGPPAYRANQKKNDSGDRGVGEQDIRPFPFPTQGGVEGETMLDDELIDRSDDE